MARRDDDRPPGTRRRPHQLGDYPVGYGRPPVAHQFKPGDRANPLGRKKKDRTKSAVNVAGLLLEPVKVSVNGRTIELPYLAAQIQIEKLKAAKGDPKAVQLLFQIARDFGLLTAQLSEEPSRIVVRFVGTPER